MITISTPDIIFVQNYQHTFQMRVVYVDMPVSDIPMAPYLGEGNFIKLISTAHTGSKTYQYTFQVQPTGYAYQKGYIILSGGGDTRTVHIFQQNAPTQIWSDTVYSYYGSADPLKYQIVDENMNVLYEGVNHVKPGELSHRLMINRIVSDYIHIDNFENFDTNNWTTYDGSSTYGIVFDGVLQRCYRFVWNWEYTRDYSGEYSVNKCLNAPINGHLADWQKWLIPISMYGARELQDEIELPTVYNDGRQITNYLTQDFAEFNKINFCMYDVSGQDVKTISIPTPYRPNITYAFGYCGDTALYYRNRLGGIDTLLIEGAVEKTDNLKREDITIDWNNNNPMEKGKQNVFTNVNTVYKLTTGLLTDEQAETLATQLIPSQDVTMFDPTTLEFTSVNITDTSVNYQTFKNNGRKFAQYTITVEETHNKFIK